MSSKQEIFDPWVYSGAYTVMDVYVQNECEKYNNKQIA